MRDVHFLYRSQSNFSSITYHKKISIFCSGYLETHVDAELKKETDKLLFDLWVHLLACGPGSTHLEMMDIVLKYPHYPLWKYMQVRFDAVYVACQTSELSSFFLPFSFILR
jgi:hypothetical protein